MQTRNYFSYLLNPLELLRTKKILQVNPTAISTREEPEAVKLFVYDFDNQNLETKEIFVYKLSSFVLQVFI